MTADPALTVEGLVKTFDGLRVLDGVDLSLGPGTITAVVGASGCGKTTLLRLVAGFDRPDGGTVTVGGHVVVSDTTFVVPQRRNLGYVAQDGALFPHLTVGRNIAYGLGRRHNGRTKLRVAELMDMVSLPKDYAERQPHELSGGQQQRVALARALARRPAVMLLDEPFSALDTGLRASTRKAVAATLTEAGVATLLVTHDQEEALSIADQVAVMCDGRFTHVGTPKDVFVTPRDRFTAEFLGECVLLPATVNSSTAECALGVVAVHPSAVHGEATVMLRPGQLVATAVDNGGPGSGRVVAREFLGSDVVLTIELPSDSAPIRVRQSSVDPVAVDAIVHLEVRGAAVVFGPGS